MRRGKLLHSRPDGGLHLACHSAEAQQVQGRSNGAIGFDRKSEAHDLEVSCIDLLRGDQLKLALNGL